jgi:hypothetical protein
VNTPLCIDRDLFIGGDWRDGNGDTRIEVMDPSTAEVLANGCGCGHRRGR